MSNIRMNSKFFTVPFILMFLLHLTQGQENTINFEIIEEQDSDTNIGDVKSEAKLGDTYNGATYKFIENEVTPYFKLAEDTGILTTSDKALDRDAEGVCKGEEDCVLTLSVSVSKIGMNPWIITVNIRVLDINDNKPSFSPGVLIRDVSESRAPSKDEADFLFPLPFASDSDSPENGIKDYELDTTSDKFALSKRRNQDGSFELYLNLTGSLDREIQNQYEFHLIAYDGGSPAKSGILNITINVEDFNDNKPVFEINPYNFKVLENATVDTIIGQVHATDKDTGSNQIIKYEFTQGTSNFYRNTFGIDPKTGELKILGRLDFDQETGQSYTLEVVAQDYGVNTQSAETTVIIEVIDINDNAPNIQLNAPEDGILNILEEESNDGSKLQAYLTVIDVDSGNSGIFNCSVSESNFQIKKKSETVYGIYTNATFDRETKDAFNLHFVCVDNGSPSLSSQNILKVKILDINDHDPVFDKPSYSFAISENNVINYQVGQVVATDLDEGPNATITYSLASDSDNSFAINATTGVITAIKVIDREKIGEEKIVLQVKASDGGKPPRTAITTVEVTIIDVDDTNPTFVKNLFNFSVRENSPASTSVGRVEATDNDYDPKNQNFYFNLRSPDFIIDHATGLISTVRSFNREDTDLYTLTVTVSSKNKRDEVNSAKVHILITDVNEFAPIFIFPNIKNNTIYISNHLPVKSFVAQIVAQDADFQTVTYSILSGNDKNEFSLAKNGTMTVKRPLDNYHGTLIHLKIMAVDDGQPKKQIVTDLFVNVNSTVIYTGPTPSPNTGTSEDDEVRNIAIGVLVAFVFILIVLGILIYFMLRRRTREKKMAAAGPKALVHYTQKQNDINENKNLAGLKLTIKGQDNGAGSFNDEKKDNLYSNGYVKNKKDSEQVPPSEKDSDSGMGTDASPGSQSTRSSQSADDADSSLSVSSQAKSEGSTPSILKMKCYHPAGHHRPMGRHPSFSEWLKTEGKFLNKKGHSYKVKDTESPHQSPQPLIPQSHPSPGGSKTVRFSDPLFAIRQSSSEDERTASPYSERMSPFGERNSPHNFVNIPQRVSPYMEPIPPPVRPQTLGVQYSSPDVLGENYVNPAYSRQLDDELNEQTLAVRHLTQGGRTVDNWPDGSVV